MTDTDDSTPTHAGVYALVSSKDPMDSQQLTVLGVEPCEDTLYEKALEMRRMEESASGGFRYLLFLQLLEEKIHRKGASTWKQVWDLCLPWDDYREQLQVIPVEIASSSEQEPPTHQRILTCIKHWHTDAMEQCDREAKEFDNIITDTTSEDIDMQLTDSYCCSSDEK